MCEEFESNPMIDYEDFEKPQDQPPRKRIALVAHDNKKRDLLEWAKFNRDTLAQHELIATGTTGHMLRNLLETDVTCLNSGPLGGDQQIGGPAFTHAA